MRHPSKLAGAHLAVLACLTSAVVRGQPASAQSGPQAPPRATAPASGHAVLRQMVGTWDVAQRIWLGPNTEPITPPPAVARRRLVGETIVEEVMEPGPASSQPPFTRVAYFNYNEVTQRYEAFSIDTRAPQMMYEKSYEDGAPGARQERLTVRLLLEDNFVLPRWGNSANAAFKGRKEIEIERDRQVVRLYWTPLAGASTGEFLAGEYVYTRQR